jgi:Fe-S oxidoreductase
MTHVQPSTRARYRPVEDPELLKMMTTHVHCGEVMQLLAEHPPQTAHPRNDVGVVTYHCACGFNFDEEAPHLT